MASITIMKGHKNLIFAAEVANQTDAEFEENGQWITISNSPELIIPRYCFDQAVDPTGQRRNRHDPQLESGWRSLLLNKRGHLQSFDDFEIIISDDKPKDKRPQFLLRFPDAAAKERAEEWAERAGFGTLTDFILQATSDFCDFWEKQAGQ